MRFIALRHLKTANGIAKPGDLIPINGWRDGVIVSEVNCGNVFDLDRRYRLGDGPAQLRREAELLASLPKYGKAVKFLDDGTAELVSVEQPIAAPAKRGRKPKVANA